MSAPRVVTEPDRRRSAHARRARGQRAGGVVPAAPARRGRMAKPRRGGTRRLPGARLAGGAAACHVRERCRRRASRARRGRPWRGGDDGAAARACSAGRDTPGSRRSRRSSSPIGSSARSASRWRPCSGRRPTTRTSTRRPRPSCRSARSADRIAIERQGAEGLVMSHMPTGDISAQIAMLDGGGRIGVAVGRARRVARGVPSGSDRRRRVRAVAARDPRAAGDRGARRVASRGAPRPRADARRGAAQGGHDRRGRGDARRVHRARRISRRR